MILDTLKNELKIPFTANITNVFLLHADKNGEHFCEENMCNGNENGEHICEETFHGIKKHIKSHHTLKLFHQPCPLDDNQHMDTPHTFSNM